ncbi:MAG: SDR family oxidoreductase [Candidatus Binatia bacterium]
MNSIALQDTKSKVDLTATQPLMHPSMILFGATSILGFNLARLFPRTILPFVTPGSRAPSLRRWPVLKLEDCAWPEALFHQHQPDFLLYCHAVCDVPKCEAAPEWAREINVEHVRRVLAALPASTRLIYVSSDHVFGGDGTYDEASSPCPISVYGRTRVEAETLVLRRKGSLVIRVGLPIGPSPNGRTGHVDWLRYRIQRKLPITIVHDEYRSVVWAGDLALRVMQLAQSGETGIRHVTATRAVSRVELANYLLSESRTSANFSRESRHERAAPHIGRVELATIYRGELCRPLSSVLDGESFLGSLPIFERIDRFQERGRRRSPQAVKYR